LSNECGADLSLVDGPGGAPEVGAFRHVSNSTAMRFPTTLVVTAALLAPSAATAQLESTLPKTTTLPASARAMALGDSYAMTSGHADALFYHPARLTSAQGFGGSLQRWGAASSAAAFSAAFDFLGGTWGVGLRALQFSVPDGSVFLAPTGQDHLFDPGGDPVSERTATIGYGRELFAGVSLGVAVDLLDTRVQSSLNNVMLFDAGLATDLGPVGIGLTAHDIGGKPWSDYGSRPSRIVLGAGTYGRQAGIFDLGFAANAGLDADDDLTYGGGVEVGYYPIQGRTFVARIGFQDVPDGSETSPLTTGFAFWADDLSIEWAFRPVSGGEEGGTHRFGVRWR